MSITFALIETKESISESIFAIHLAYALSNQTKEKVGILDLSFSLIDEPSILLGHKSTKSISNILPYIETINTEILQGFFEIYFDKISFISGPTYDQKDIFNLDLTQNILDKYLNINRFNIIITPRNDINFIKTIVDYVDIFLILVSPNILSIKETQLFFEIFKENHKIIQDIKMIIIRKKESPLAKPEDIKNLFGIMPFADICIDYNLLFESINSSSPFSTKFLKSSLALDIDNIAKNLISYISIDNFESNKNKLSSKNTNNNSINSDLKKEYIKNLKIKIHKYILNNTDLNISEIIKQTERNNEELREKIKKLILEIFFQENHNLTKEEISLFIEEILNEVLGLGCLEPLIKDNQITEIMVNGLDNVYVEKKGIIESTDIKFQSIQQIMTVIDRIVSPIGRRIDESSPIVDARLIDGSRVNIVINPVSLSGPIITIRKFSKNDFSIKDLINMGSLSEEMAEFLKISVLLRKNILISGGTGSGKTTLLNIISSFIPSNERIITIEDSAELKLQQKHVIRLETRPPSCEGKNEISIRRLVINALRMRPDRLIVGECRGGETLDMLQAMNTGHDGSLTTIHANSPKDAISRLVTMALMADIDLPERSILEQIKSAIQIIIQVKRFSDGSRKIIEISELNTNIENTDVLKPIFIFRQTNQDNYIVKGEYIKTGKIPSFIDDIKIRDLHLNSHVSIK